jgi:hypothetical protein
MISALLIHHPKSQKPIPKEELSPFYPVTLLPFSTSVTFSHMQNLEIGLTDAIVANMKARKRIGFSKKILTFWTRLNHVTSSEAQLSAQLK